RSVAQAPCARQGRERGRLSRRADQSSALRRRPRRYFRRLRRDRDAGSSWRRPQGAWFHRRSRVLYLVDVDRLAGCVVATFRGRGRSSARCPARRPPRPRRPPPAHRNRADRGAGSQEKRPPRPRPKLTRPLAHAAFGGAPKFSPKTPTLRLQPTPPPPLLHRPP